MSLGTPHPRHHHFDPKKRRHTAWAPRAPNFGKDEKEHRCPLSAHNECFLFAFGRLFGMGFPGHAFDETSELARTFATHSNRAILPTCVAKPRSKNQVSSMRCPSRPSLGQNTTPQCKPNQTCNVAVSLLVHPCSVWLHTRQGLPVGIPFIAHVVAHPWPSLDSGAVTCAWNW